MRLCLLSLVVLACLADVAFSQEVDKAKLRAAVDFPNIKLSFGLGIDVDERDDLGNRRDYGREIAKETRRLKGTVDDAKVYLKLAGLYSVTDRVKMTVSVRKAQEILEPYLKTADSRNAYLLTWYCEALEYLDSDPRVEPERIALRALKLAPTDARVWSNLGLVCTLEAFQILLGDFYGEVLQNQRRDAAIAAISDGRPTTRDLDEAEKYLKAARQCNDRARELAPKDIEIGETRVRFLVAECGIRNAIAVARGNSPGVPFLKDLEVMAALKALADLCPDRLSWQFGAGAMEITRVSAPYWAKYGSDVEKWPAIPEENWQYVKQRMVQIEKIAENAGVSEGAVFCRRALIGFSMEMGDLKKTETYARAVLQADPQDTSASEAVEWCLRETGRVKEADKFARARFDKSPTGRNHYLHARNLFNGKHESEAEGILRAALKHYPEDASCLVGLAALLMKTNINSKALDEVKNLLDQANSVALRSGNPADLPATIEFYESIHRALTGDESIAYLKLQRLHADNPTNERITKALAAFGK